MIAKPMEGTAVKNVCECRRGKRTRIANLVGPRPQGQVDRMNREGAYRDHCDMLNGPAVFGSVEAWHSLHSSFTHSL